MNDDFAANEMKSGLDISLPFFQDVGLRISVVNHNGDDYPSSQLQKGLILVSDGQELVEEGVGFGVPVLMKGLKTIFAGNVNLIQAERNLETEIAATFYMNREERLASRSGTTIGSNSLYKIKHYLEDLHRRSTLARGFLTSFSDWYLRRLSLRKTFEDAGCNYPIKVNFSLNWESRTVKIDVDATGVPEGEVDQVILMNEQGARYFDTYIDTSGSLLQGAEIESWQTVTAERASFLSRSHHLSFSLQQVSGATLFRGRELVGSRLAWAGFGYSLPPSRRSIAYTLEIERLQ